jgi:hypothetical protein
MRDAPPSVLLPSISRDSGGRPTRRCAGDGTLATTTWEVMTTRAAGSSRRSIVGGTVAALVLVAISAVALAGLASDSDGAGQAASTAAPPTRSEETARAAAPQNLDIDGRRVLDRAFARDGLRLLFSESAVRRSVERMGAPGPYFAAGDAGHGGPYSPGDGQRSVQLAAAFLADPQASYWVQPGLPFSSGDASPSDDVHIRPMHAAWVYMSQPGHPRHDDLLREVKRLLLFQASHESLDYADASDYPVSYPGFSPNPIFPHAHWMTRLIKSRDMIGRDSFTAQENAVFDRWLYDYANWSFQWLHKGAYVQIFPGRSTRDYSVITSSPDADRRSYDGGPLIGSVARAYTNRHAAVASAASLAANYLAFHDYQAPTTGGPGYGQFTVDELLLHSRLFVEETLRFSVYPEGFQADFERGDAAVHSSRMPQIGWLYSINVLANLVEMAEYHAQRGDMSLWNYRTTSGFDGTQGAPVAGGFQAKNLHFFAWSMSRYVNNGWGRTNRGEPLALPNFYHDVIPAAIASTYVPSDGLLQAAWRRSGSGFPPYPQEAQRQGRWDARLGEGAKSIGLIEHASRTSTS